LYDDIEEPYSEAEIDNPVNEDGDEDDDFADLFNQIIQFLNRNRTSSC
jgi:hypothetical protein